MKQIEFKDIQGLIVRGFSDLNAACFLLLEVKDPSQARQWLKGVIQEVTDGVTKSGEQALQIAFTYAGLKALGLHDEVLQTFGREFREGMVTDHRKRILGDIGASDPANWQWGGTATEVHIVLMLYSKHQESLDAYCNSQTGKCKGVGVIKKLNSDLSILKKRKEQFGFHDGISQPLIKGFSKQGDPEFMSEPGEFIMGYNNEYQILPESPWVPASYDPYNVLPVLEDGSHNYDLGKNGSYMVFRQLSQDVLRFWKYMDNATKDDSGKSSENARVRLASKMVGRWPGGAPLVKSPDFDDPALKDFNSFEYNSTDSKGLKCPFGSHIRRSNPRNSLGPTPKDSDMISKRHRILRRGRPYGSFIHSNDPNEIAKHEQISEDRGLHFICFNTNISRQFEFIQDTWVNSSKFAGLYNDPDPIAGNPIGRCKGETGDFTIQSVPVRERYSDVPAFVTTVGGAYFFMPGIKALKYIASVQ